MPLPFGTGLPWPREDRAPTFYHQLLPAETMQNCMMLWGNLSALDNYIQDFMHSLHLFCHSTAMLGGAYAIPREDQSRRDERNKKIDMFHYWRMTAARNAALVVFDFGRARDGIHETLGLLPEVRAFSDPQLMRTASKTFDRLFPTYVQMRHGVAHAQEKGATVKEADAHTIKDETIAAQFNTIGGNGVRFSSARGSFVLGGTGSQALVQMALSDDTFKTAWEGRMIELKINEQTASDMRAVKAAYYDAFGAIENAMFVKRWGEPQQPQEQPEHGG
jgi:hypothetical protein